MMKGYSMKKYIFPLIVLLLTGCASTSDKFFTAIYSNKATPMEIDRYLALGAKLNVPGGYMKSETALG